MFTEQRLVFEKDDSPEKVKAAAGMTRESLRDQLAPLRRALEGKSAAREAREAVMDEGSVAIVVEGVREANVVPEADAGQAAHDADLYYKFEDVAYFLASLFSGKEESELRESYGPVVEDWEKHFFGASDEVPPEGVVEDAPASLEVAGPAKRQEIVNAAMGVVGSTAFRGSEVRGGVLACAQVVSSVLQSVGLIDGEYLGVADTSDALEAAGWTRKPASAAPEAGDVVVWERTQSSYRSDGSVALGHKHIGISLGDGRAISNSSGKKSPWIHDEDFWGSRDVEYYLSPPEGVVA